MNDSYSAYVAAAKVTAKWELPHDMLENGIIVHHVPKDTSKGYAIVNSIRFAVKKAGFTPRITWLDDWTLKVIWLNQ